MRLIGLDPGLRRTGWGVIEADGNRLRHVAAGVVISTNERALADRLAELHDGIAAVLERLGPVEGAVEGAFVNRNADSTLKLGMARGAVLLAASRAGLAVAEYPPARVKKSVVGTGQADKEQVAHMVRLLLPGSEAANDAADALAVAICHAHYVSTGRAWARGLEMAAP
jgi:crossover junction endodeoxyribonuclease RuvC